MSSKNFVGDLQMKGNKKNNIVDNINMNLKLQNEPPKMN